MEDKNELKVIALRSALDLAITNNKGNGAKTAGSVVEDAKTLYDFLVKEDDNKDTE